MNVMCKFRASFADCSNMQVGEDSHEDEEGQVHPTRPKPNPQDGTQPAWTAWLPALVSASRGASLPRGYERLADAIHLPVWVTIGARVQPSSDVCGQTDCAVRQCVRTMRCVSRSVGQSVQTISSDAMWLRWSQGDICGVGS